MKPLLALVLALAGCSSLNQPAATGEKASVCIAAYQIDRTDRPDDNTILFTMRDRSVYRAHLEQPCPGLSNDPRGFTYEPTDPGSDTLCAHLLTIRLNTYDSFCTVGAIDRLPDKGRL